MIRIAPLRLEEHSRWAQLWSEYQLFYGVELPASVSGSTWQRLHDGRVQGLGARNAADYLVGIVCRICTWIRRPAEPAAAGC